ncbi:ATP-binding protein [Streptomyces sp. ISL-36]|uniref:ATP-binding protein n=1 Tax=Streptomyces sp. ISL-36 TaxID=2819182 RepID=UPI001BEC95F9|nr:ATP-binding protein [Streptomyces sp. ISL-36]MBT2444144.1 ATP-binding protein [Streptomyces sp. ISL-36]
MTTPPSPTFALRFTATPRGARLARRLASHQMDLWGWGYGTPAHDTVELVVAELAANAVTHGRVPGRDAELRLSAGDDGHVRVEVSDTRGERQPVPVRDDSPDAEADANADADGGRGLAIVTALATEWGTTTRAGAPGKTVWAVVACATLPAR